MMIDTKFWGTMEIEEGIIEFHEGLPGFEGERHFVILDVPDNAFFKVMQDVDERRLAFVLANPWEFDPEYEMDIPDDELELIGISDAQSLQVYCIVTLKEEVLDSTMNMLAPILINLKDGIGRQCVLKDSDHNVRKKLFDKENEVLENACAQ